MKDNTVLRAAMVMAGQFVALCLIGMLGIWLCVAAGFMAGAAYDWLMWLVLPVVGAVSAVFATRLGLPYGLAWIAPPVCMVLAQWLLMAMLPTSPGMPMVSLLVAVVGAATGEEIKRREKR